MIILVMGTEGSGKTTVGKLLASQIGFEFFDGDDFHPVANIQKMKQGIPLTDQDRAPWLDSMHQSILQWSAQQRSVVLASSALKREYRQRLSAGTPIQIVYLKGSYDLMLQRVRERKGHFANESLLKSQFADLQEPTNAITVDVSPPPEEVVAEIRKHLK